MPTACLIPHRSHPTLHTQVPHAYCLLALSASPNDDAEPLVKLRNPNGHAGWRGAWSRGSPQWT